MQLRQLWTVRTMPNRAADSQSSRHSLSDWLVLHELDPVTCRRILDAMALENAAPPSDDELEEYQAIDLEVAWLRAVEAMRDFLPEQQGIVDNTFENSAKIVVDDPNKPRKALTLDNGSGAYPTIVYSYRGKPIDELTIAHEFAHAVQIVASQGRFVPPIVREICAFLGEGALLSHAGRRHRTQYTHLLQAWDKANHRHFGVLKEGLQAALSSSDMPYKYAWNYPIARYLALQIADQCSQDCIWSIFQGKSSLKDVLRELRFPQS